MRATSFLGTVRHVEAQLRALEDRRRFDAPGPIGDRVWSAFDGLADLAELVAANFPLPSLAEPPSEDADEAVRAVLRAAYEREEPVTPEDADPAALESGRVEAVAGELVVPLPEGGPAAANWFVVYPWLGDRLDDVRGTCRRLAGRVDREGWPEFADALRGLQSVVEDLRQVVGHAVAVTEWVAPPDGGVDGDARDARQTAARLVEKLSNEL